MYDVRLQPCRMTASSLGAVPTNCDNSWGELLDRRYDFHLGNGDNSNVYGITHYGDQTRNQAFTYDGLNRLISAQNAGTDCTKTLPDGHTEYWGNSYGYDAWGNMLGKTPTKCSAENLSLTATANNQLQGGYTYDAAGNMMHDATANLNYAYDQENRIAGAAAFTYTYDADGNRVEKANGATGTLYWYMSLGIVGESDLAGALKSEYVFFDGERVARKDFPSNAVSYYFSDHLKTASVVTDAVGTIKSESDYYPWGGELQFTNNDSNHYKFTGKERDSETGLDYFGARYYGNALGRFTSADPMLVDHARLMDPQRMNMYVYARNNPMRYIDPDGNDPIDGVKNNVNYKTTDVHGANASEALNNANAQGESGFAGKTHVDYVYTFEVNWSTNPAQGTAIEAVTNVDVDATITVTTPNWVEQNNASEQDKKSWDQSMADLKDHEEGHVKLDKEGAQELHDNIKGTSATGSGKTPEAARKDADANLKQKVDAKANDTFRKNDKKNKDYDDATDHGKKHEKKKD